MVSYDFYYFFFFNVPATTEIYTLSLHDALPIYAEFDEEWHSERVCKIIDKVRRHQRENEALVESFQEKLSDAKKKRSEEHTSELQSRQYLVCRLLLEKKKEDRRQQDMASQPGVL